MKLSSHSGVARFINSAKQQREWLSSELSSLEASSETYKNNQRAISGALQELDSVIWNAIQIYAPERER